MSGQTVVESADCPTVFIFPLRNNLLNFRWADSHTLKTIFHSVPRKLLSLFCKRRNRVSEKLGRLTKVNYLK